MDDAYGTTPPTEGPEAPEGLVGTVLAGRYRVLELLGTGAMGAVYLGEHLKMGRKDAIKLLHRSMERDPEAVARFTRGARNASLIRHPNVCTVYDFGETESGLAFLAMEYVEGEQLSDLLSREGPMETGRAIRMMIQVADALQAAHHRGIVHRDLKPGNIMIGRDREGNDLVKVVDFDIAKGGVEGEEDEVTRLGFVVGTPEYMSPEQLTGDPLDGRSDLYSLGLVLFKALTGGYPFPGGTTQELMVKKLTEDPLPLEDVLPGAAFPDGLQATLDRALQRKAQDRFPDAAAMRAALLSSLPADSPNQMAAEGSSPTPELVPPTEAFESAEVPLSTALPPTVAAPVETQEIEAAPWTGRSVLMGVGGATVLGAVGLMAWSIAQGGGALSVQAQPGTLSLPVGESFEVDGRVTGEDGSPVDGAVLAWSTNAADVASVTSSGRVDAIGPGRAVVTVSYGSASDSVVITVEQPAVPTLDPVRIELSATAGQPGTSQRARLLGVSAPASVDLVAVGPDGAEVDWIRAEWNQEGSGGWIEVSADATLLNPGSYSGEVRVDVGVAAVVALSVVLDVVSRRQPPPRVDIDALLRRQLGHLDVSGGAPARAVRDTVAGVLAQATLTPSQRALGAFVLANALWELEEACEALHRAEEAVAIEPENGPYVAVRDQLLVGCR